MDLLWMRDWQRKQRVNLSTKKQAKTIDYKLQFIFVMIQQQKENESYKKSLSILTEFTRRDVFNVELMSELISIRLYWCYNLFFKCWLDVTTNLMFNVDLMLQQTWCSMLTWCYNKLDLLCWVDVSTNLKFYVELMFQQTWSSMLS